MFWAFKLNLVVDILAFFGLETAWATFFKNWANFFSNILITLFPGSLDSNPGTLDKLLLC
jgi:hypothetical protein